jgi:hypothetical protein
VIHGLLDAVDDLIDFFLHSVEVLILGQEGELVHFIEFAKAVGKEMTHFGLGPLLAGQVLDQDRVVRKGARPLVVVIPSLGD